MFLLAVLAVHAVAVQWDGREDRGWNEGATNAGGYAITSSDANSDLLGSLISKPIDVLKEILLPMSERHKAEKATPMFDSKKVVDAVDDTAMKLIYGRNYNCAREGSSDSGPCKAKPIPQDWNALKEQYDNDAARTKDNAGTQVNFGYAITPLRMKLWLEGKKKPWPEGTEPGDLNYMGEKEATAALGDVILKDKQNFDSQVTGEGGLVQSEDGIAKLGMEDKRTIDCIVQKKPDGSKDCFKIGEGPSLQTWLDDIKTETTDRARNFENGLTGLGASMSDPPIRSTDDATKAMQSVLDRLIGHGEALDSINDASETAIGKFREVGDKYIAPAVHMQSDTGGSSVMGGDLAVALEDLAAQYHDATQRLIDARRKKYFGSIENSFGDGGLSKEVMDMRVALKESDREHTTAAQAYAAMGSQIKALIDTAQRRLRMDLMKFKKYEEKEDKRAFKGWKAAVEGRGGAYDLLSALEREKSKESTDEVKNNIGEYRDTERAQKAAIKSGFQAAMKDMRKTGQAASRAKLAAEDVETAVDETKIALRTDLNAADQVTMLKTKMQDAISRDKRDVTSVFRELDELGTAAQEQTTKDINQYGHEAAATMSTVFNQRAHDLADRRKHEERTFAESVKKIARLGEEENEPLNRLPLAMKINNMDKMVSDLREVQTNGEESAIVQQHKADHAKQLQREIDKVEAKRAELAGTATDPEPASKFTQAETEFNELENEYTSGMTGDLESEKGHLRKAADKDAVFIDKLAEKVTGKLGELKIADENTNTILTAEQAKVNTINAQLNTLTSEGEATSIGHQTTQATQASSGIVDEAQQQEKAIDQQFETAEQAVVANTESAATSALQQASSVQASTDSDLHDWQQGEVRKGGQVVAQMKAVKDTAEDKMGDEDEERSAAEDSIATAKSSQDSNAETYKGRLQTYKNDESQRIKQFKGSVDELMGQIPSKFAKVATDAGAALLSLQTETDTDLHAPGGKAMANKDAVAAIRTEAEGVAVSKHHEVDETEEQGDKRLQAAERTYKRVTGAYSDEELGALKAADALYNELEEVREDMTASALIALDDPKIAKQKLEERERLLLEMVHKKMDGLDSYARTQAKLAITNTNNKIEEILADEEMSDEEKQAAIEALEIKMQNTLLSLDGAGEGVQKMLHLVGAKIDAQDVEKVEAELELDRAVKQGLSDEAEARRKEGADANAVLEKDLTVAEKIQRELTALETAAGGMLQGQEAGWQAKLKVATAQLSQQLGKDLRVGTQQVRDEASVAVNRSDALVKDVDSDRRQLDQSVKKMAEDLHEAKAYFDSHAKAEEVAVDALREATDVEPVLKPQVTKLGTLYQAATKMHVDIQGAIYAAQHDGQDTEDALEKAASFEVADEAEAEKFVPKAHELFSRHAATAGWFASYEAGDLAFKRAVANKLRRLSQELGLDLSVDMRDIEGARSGNFDSLDAELSKELDENQRKTAQALKAMYDDSDARIAKLREDASLSDAERRARIAEIEAENRKKARDLFAEQEQMKQRQASLENALAKYQAKVAQAEQAAKEAIAQGILSPAALDTTRKLGEAQMQLQKVRNQPLFSAIELKEISDSAGGAGDLKDYVDNLGQLQKADVVLAKQDAKLAKRVSQLEKILEA